MVELLISTTNGYHSLSTRISESSLPNCPTYILRKGVFPPFRCMPIHEPYWRCPLACASIYPPNNARNCPQGPVEARYMYAQFFSHFHETLPFNYDSPVPEGGMREGGRNGSVIRWSWGGWRSSRAYHMIREGTGRGREERGVFRNKHSSVFRRPYLALALRCQEVRIRISFTDFSFKRV